MKTIRIGGVPEHFNLPWHLAIENGHFEKAGIDVKWQSFPGGTGAMSQALRNNEVDLCVILTEGIVADILKGNPSKIVSQYLNTPLIWGVFTGANNPINYYGQIYDKTYAISRFGSGSHLIPQVDANAKRFVLKPNQFKIVKNLNGALQSLANNETDVFYWEKYTTMPYVYNGTLKYLGEYVTPWSCFVVAGTNNILNTETETVKTVMNIIHFVAQQFMESQNPIELVAERYNLKLEDVTRWFHCTEWSVSNKISNKMLSNVMYQLKSAGIINEVGSTEDLIFKL